MLSVDVKKQLRDFTLEAALEVEEGEIRVLIGENGAGKSTLLNLISGLLCPDQGTITLGEKVLFSRPDRIDVPTEYRNIGHLFQSYALFPHLSVFDNVAFGLRCRRVPEPAISSRVNKFLMEMDLESLSGERVGSLSGGQRQRVALIRALILEPDLLLLDEPLAALDVKSQASMRKELRESIKAAGIPAVIVTHNYLDALSLADYLYLIERGRITAQGAPSEMVLRQENLFISNFFGKYEPQMNR